MVKIQLTDYVMRNTRAAQDWVRERRRASLITLLEYTGHHDTDASKLHSGEHDFDAIVAGHRAYQRRLHAPSLDTRTQPGETPQSRPDRPPGLGDLGSPAPAPVQSRTRRKRKH